MGGRGCFLVFSPCLDLGRPGPHGTLLPRAGSEPSQEPERWLRLHHPEIFSSWLSLWHHPAERLQENRKPR